MSGPYRTLPEPLSAEKLAVIRGGLAVAKVSDDAVALLGKRLQTDGAEDGGIVLGAGAILLTLLLLRAGFWNALGRPSWAVSVTSIVLLVFLCRWIRRLWPPRPRVTFHRGAGYVTIERAGAFRYRLPFPAFAW